VGDGVGGVKKVLGGEHPRVGRVDNSLVMAERTLVAYDVDLEREKLQFEKHKFQADFKTCINRVSR